MNILFAALAVVDIIAGAVLTMGTASILPGIANYLGIILILKGVWSLIMSLA